mgnify:CR=1 FL=1
MPYKCENCKEIGARMNLLFEIRLCKKCVNSSKYKLISKSKAIIKYFLNKNDLVSNCDLVKKFFVGNPYYKTGPPMTLYLENEIQQIFLKKYNNLLNDFFIILNPQNNMENVLFIMKKYFDEKKNYRKNNKKNILSI